MSDAKQFGYPMRLGKTIMEQRPVHPLNQMFHEVVHEQTVKHLGEISMSAEQYLVDLLVAFVRMERVFAVRNAAGHRVESIIEMVAEGDVRLHADSFTREREVHKHIGDFILFWSGVYPDFLRKVKLQSGFDLVCDYTRQGKESYHLVSTFSFAPFDQEAPTFQTLSDGFEDFAFVLQQVSRQTGIYAA